MRLLMAAALLLAPMSAQAQDSSGCSKFKWPVGRELAAFSSPDLPVLPTGETLPAVGHAASLKLKPQAEVSFVRPPGRKAKADPAYATVVSLPPVASAGRYDITLSGEAWIDVLQNGKEVRSSGFSDEPDCPGVRKSVRFLLQPGPATVQISGSGADSIKVDVLPAE